MDGHLAALLKGLSFKQLYRSTAKPVNVLNTVAERARQTTQVLPPVRNSVDIPAFIERKGRKRRLTHGGVVNPLYDLDYSSVQAPNANNSIQNQSSNSSSQHAPSPSSQPPASSSTQPPSSPSPQSPA